MDATAANIAITQRETEKNRALALEGQVTDRYTKAIAQLGDPKLEVRLGGIYALERIANDSMRDVKTIMDVLCAFVREKTPLSKVPSKAKKVAKIKEKPTTDIQAALTVIGRLPNTLGANVDLSNTRLVGANLSGATLSKANFNKTNLNQAILNRTILNKATLDEAILNEADLSYANLNEAYLNNAIMKGAILNGTNLSWAKLYRANLHKADLSGADLGDANLTEAILTETVFNTKFPKKIYSHEELINAEDLEETNFSGASLIGARLNKAVGLKGSQINSAMTDDSTQLPLSLQVYEWNPDKAQYNLSKYGISFQEAITVLNDDLSIHEDNVNRSSGEVYSRILGRSDQGRLLVVIYNSHSKPIRIISARKATPQESSRYSGPNSSN